MRRKISWTDGKTDGQRKNSIPLRWSGGIIMCHHSIIYTTKSYSYIFLTGNPILSRNFANNRLNSIQIIIAVQIPTISPKFQNISHYTWYNIGRRMEHLKNMSPYCPWLHFVSIQTWLTIVLLTTTMSLSNYYLQNTKIYLINHVSAEAQTTGRVIPSGINSSLAEISTK